MRLTFFSKTQFFEAGFKGTSFDKEVSPTLDITTSGGFLCGPWKSYALTPCFFFCFGSGLCCRKFAVYELEAC